MKNRRKIEVIADILEITRNGEKKTHIMYKGNLSFSLLKSYLALLTGCKLLKYQEDKSLYILSDRGKAFLEDFKKLDVNLKSLQNKLDYLKSEMKVMELKCFNKK